MSEQREMTLREYIDSKPLHKGHLIVKQLTEYESQASQIQELEKQLETASNKNSIEEYNESEDIKSENALERLRYFCSLSMSQDDWVNVGSFFVELEKQLAESVLRKNLDEMWPTFLEWYGKYIGEDCPIDGNYSFSREDMRYAFQAGHELLTPPAKGERE